MSAIVNNLKSLLRFSGRTPRRAFWPYAGLVVISVMLLSMAPFAILVDSMFAEEAAFDIGVARPPDLMVFVTWAAFTIGLLVVLLAAAVLRRLHDRGLSGRFGLMPLPFVAVSMSVFPMLIQSFMSPQPDMRLFAAVFLSNVLYLAALVLLAVLLAGPSSPGPNRFGDKAG